MEVKFCGQIYIKYILQTVTRTRFSFEKEDIIYSTSIVNGLQTTQRASDYI